MTGIICPLDDGCAELYLSDAIDLRIIPRPESMPQWAWEKAVPRSHQPLLWLQYQRLIVPQRRTAAGRSREALASDMRELTPQGRSELLTYMVSRGLTPAEMVEQCQALLAEVVQ